MTDTTELTYVGPFPAGVVALPEGRSLPFVRGVAVSVSAEDAELLDPDDWAKPAKTKASKAATQADPAASKEA